MPFPASGDDDTTTVNEGKEHPSMSLTSQISQTIATLASTREARREALGRIRQDSARHLGEAHAARRRSALEQQKRLDEALRSIKLGTAILLGEADERIDRYRKERAQQAARLDRALADDFKALRGNTRKWLGAQAAQRNAEAAKALGQRQQDRKALGNAVQELTADNIAFLAALTKDRQQASSLWHGRAPSGTPAKVEPAPVAPAKVEPPKVEAAAVVEPVKPAPAPVEAAPAEPAKAEPAKVEPAKAEPIKAEPAKADSAKTAPATADSKPGNAKPAADKASGDKTTSGKSA